MQPPRHVQEIYDIMVVGLLLSPVIPSDPFDWRSGQAKGVEESLVGVTFAIHCKGDSSIRYAHSE